MSMKWTWMSMKSTQILDFSVPSARSGPMTSAWEEIRANKFRPWGPRELPTQVPLFPVYAGSHVSCTVFFLVG